ncbi:FecCD family ABC transporter permease [Paenibacillus sp. 1001270B_150601_E10]|uniref:FecCD family ABC transporter permease n=1 Tax=Paenibacillus sp. 1001270B_150601_E10 TaxID=2787079 RepID=UPI00189EE3E5|nr:iron ABC transporter permease [Paenibacillus sp. 1001270B_150601_E10]
MRANAANATNPRLKRTWTVLGIATVLIMVMVIVSLNSGTIRLSPSEVWSTLMGQGTSKQQLILIEFRLPRIVISILIGAGLAIAGAILQGITRNVLADPGILGINAGAGLAVLLFISFFPLDQSSNIFTMPVAALVGAGLTAAIIYLLSYKKGRGIHPIRLVLVGIGVAAGIQAAMIVLSIRLDPTNYQAIAIWLAGNIRGSNWTYVIAMLPWLLILLPYVWSRSRTLDILSLGDQVATGLGVQVEKARLGLLAAAVMLSGASVAVGGGIGFVGLIAPHLARRLVGPGHQEMLPASAFLGGLLVLTADTLARVLLPSGEIPTGIVVAVIGAPYFLYLLVTTKA